MHRRDVLAALAGSGSVLGTAGVVAGARSLHDTAGSRHHDRRSTSSGGSSAEQEAYEPLGTVDVDGTRELAVGDDGTVAYLAVDDGIATVDVSDPTAPRVLAERRGFFEDDPDGPLRLVWDAWPDGDRLLAAGPAQQVAGSGLNGAVLVDVSDPANPRVLDELRTDFPIHNCFFEDGRAYLTGNGRLGNPLVILDASGDRLEEVGEWALHDHDPAWDGVNTALRQLHDVYVQDDVAYLAYWDAGTYLLDVSDPAEPAYVGHTGHYTPSKLRDVSDFATAMLSPPGNSHYVQVDETGDLMAVGRESWSSGGRSCPGGPSGIELYDVSDPTDVVHLSSIDPPKSASNGRNGQFTTAHNLDLVDGRCYSSWYFGGVKVHDVSDPADPEELAWWRQPDEAVFWTAQSGVPGEYFLASSADDAAGFDDGIGGRVYVFPDRAGEQADPPSLVDPPGGGGGRTDCSLRGPNRWASGDGPGGPAWITERG